MSIYFGNDMVKDLYVGLTPVSKGYVGTHLFYNGDNTIIDITYEKYILNTRFSTLYNTAEKPVKSAILKGNTLVNLVSSCAFGGNSTIYEYRFYDRPVQSGETLTVFVVNPNISTIKVGLYNSKTNSWEGEHTFDVSINKKVVYTVRSNNLTKYVGVIVNNRNDSTGFENGLVIVQGDQTHLEVDTYFEGMQSVKLPVLTVYNQENLFKNYIKDGSQWGIDFNCTTTDVKYSQNGGYVKIIGDSSLCYSGFASPSLLQGTYKFSCKVKVGQVGDSYRILAHNNPNGAANNANGFVSVKITSTKEIETFEYVGYFSGANNMLLYTYYKGQEIEYYDIMFTKLSDEDVTNVVQSYTYKSNILTVNEDVTLRSNGDVYDELNLLTGRLTQRIDENNEVLAQEIVKTVDLSVADQDGNNAELSTFNDITHVTLSSEGLIPVAELEVATKNEEVLNTMSLEMDDISTTQNALQETSNTQSENVDATMLATTEIYEGLL